MIFISQEEAGRSGHFTEKASFSRNSYGSPEAIKQGERRSFDEWKRAVAILLPSPASPSRILQIVEHFSGREMDAEISTLPWELCDAASNGSPSVIGNFLKALLLRAWTSGGTKTVIPKRGSPLAYRSSTLVKNLFMKVALKMAARVTLRSFRSCSTRPQKITAPNIAYQSTLQRPRHRLAHRMPELPFSPIRHRPRAQH